MTDLYSQLQKYEKGQAQKLPTVGTVSGIDGDRVDVLVRGSSTILRNVKTVGTASAIGQAVVLSWDNGIPTAHLTGGMGTPAEISAISRGPAGAAGTNGTNGAPGAQGPQGEPGPQGPVGSLEAGSPVTQLELIATPPTPPAGSMSIYPKTDRKFYKLDADGVETELGGGAIAHALATAANDFLVASGAGAFVKKTLAETITVLRTALDSVYAAANHTHPVRELLAASRTYYVRPDGNDSNNGLSNTAGGAFLTIQKAVDTVAGLDRGIHAVTISVANGTYASAVLKEGLGSADIAITGNTATPSSCVIPTFSAGGIATRYVITGFRFSGGYTAIGADSGALVSFGQCDFGAGYGYHMQATGGARIVAVGNYTISGSATYAHVSPRLGFINLNSRLITLTGTPALGAFAEVRYTGVLWTVSTTFSGSASAGTRKYVVDTNGVIQSGGVLASYPGGTAGTVSTGGQVL